MRANGIRIFNSRAGLGTPNQAFALGLSTGKIRFWTGTTGFDSTALYAANQWNHVVLVHDGYGAIRAFVNGVKNVGTGGIPPAAGVYADALFGGAAGSQPVNGPIDSIGFWNLALTDAEVAELYNSGLGWEPSASDDTPDDFAFTDVADADPSTVYESDLQTITGMDAGAAISATGGEYRLDGGAWTAATGTINPGQTLELRATSSSDPETLVMVNVKVGSVLANWSITTAAVVSVITNILYGSTPETSRILRSRIVQGIV